MVGAGEPLDRTELGHGGGELAAAAVSEGVVSQDALDGDAVGGEEPAGSAQELRAGGGLFVGQHLGIGQPGVVVDGGVEVVVAGAVTPPAVPVTGSMLGRVAAVDAVAAAIAQPPQFLD